MILFYLKLLCGCERIMFKSASLMISIWKLYTVCHQDSIRFSGWKLSKKINGNKKKGWKLFWLLAVWSIITPQEQIIPFLTTSLSLNKVSMPMVRWILLGSWNILASIPRHWNNNIDNYASVITSTEINGLRDGCPSSLQWQILACKSPWVQVPLYPAARVDYSFNFQIVLWFASSWLGF